MFACNTDEIELIFLACPPQCPDSCTEEGECGCHRLCRGICKRPNDPSGCIVCNEVGEKGEIGYLDKNLTCVESCPPKTLEVSFNFTISNIRNSNLSFKKILNSCLKLFTAVYSIKAELLFVFQ